MVNAWVILGADALRYLTLGPLDFVQFHPEMEATVHSLNAKRRRKAQEKCASKQLEPPPMARPFG